MWLRSHQCNPFWHAHMRAHNKVVKKTPIMWHLFLILQMRFYVTFYLTGQVIRNNSHLRRQPGEDYRADCRVKTTVMLLDLYFWKAWCFAPTNKRQRSAQALPGKRDMNGKSWHAVTSECSKVRKRCVTNKYLCRIVYSLASETCNRFLCVLQKGS